MVANQAAVVPKNHVKGLNFLAFFMPVKTGRITLFTTRTIKPPCHDFQVGFATSDGSITPVVHVYCTVQQGEASTSRYNTLRPLWFRKLRFQCPNQLAVRGIIRAVAVKSTYKHWYSLSKIGTDGNCKLEPRGTSSNKAVAATGQPIPEGASCR
jgi:hypothetical protein